MTREDLLETYEILSPAEAYEAFDAAGIEPETVGLVLGKEVENQYANWIYLTQK